MKKMRSRMLSALAAGVVATGMVAPSMSQAAVFFDVDGAGPRVSRELVQLDWLAGNTLAIGGVTAITNFVTGAGTTEFNAVYQAVLNSAQTTTGTVQPVGPGPDDPPTSEFTIVGGYRERVVAVGASSATFEFVDSDFDYIEIYFGERNANNLAGTGFNDGQLILRANITTATTATFTVDSDAPIEALDQQLSPLFDEPAGDNYPGVQSVIGEGQTSVRADIIDFDPAFFQFDDLADGFIDITFLNNIGLAAPFRAVNPSSAFVVGANPGPIGSAGAAPNFGLGADNGDGTGGTIGPVNGLFGAGGTDFQIQTDANQTFGTALAVPEPATLSLLALGGLGLIARRRRQA